MTLVTSSDRSLSRLLEIREQVWQQIPQLIYMRHWKRFSWTKWWTNCGQTISQPEVVNIIHQKKRRILCTRKQKINSYRRLGAAWKQCHINTIKPHVCVISQFKSDKRWYNLHGISQREVRLCQKSLSSQKWNQKPWEYYQTNNQNHQQYNQNLEWRKIVSITFGDIPSCPLSSD